MVIVLCLLGTIAEAAPLKIAVSVAPLLEYVKEVGGDKIKVIGLLPQSLCPHDYQLKPSQLKELSLADGVILMGSGFSVEDMIKNQLNAFKKKKPLMSAVDGIKLLEMNRTHEVDGASHDEGHHHHHSVGDPHIWMSLQNLQIIVDHIALFLGELKPEHAAYFKQNAEAYKNRLKSMDRSMQLAIEQKGIKNWFVVHPSWGYFVRDYGLKQVAIEQYGQEPSARHMMEFSDLVRKSEWKYIIISSQQDRRMGEVMVANTAAQLFLFDPVAADFTKQMEQLIKNLQNNRTKEQ